MNNTARNFAEKVIEGEIVLEKDAQEFWSRVSCETRGLAFGNLGSTTITYTPKATDDRQVVSARYGAAHNCGIKDYAERVADATQRVLQEGYVEYFANVRQAVGNILRELLLDIKQSEHSPTFYILAENSEELQNLAYQFSYCIQDQHLLTNIHELLLTINQSVLIHDSDKQAMLYFNQSQPMEIVKDEKSISSVKHRVFDMAPVLRFLRRPETTEITSKYIQALRQHCTA